MNEQPADRTTSVRGARRRPRRRKAALTALLAALAAVAVACGGGSIDEVGDDAAVPSAGTDAAAPEVTIRLAMPVDPLWQWLVDSGTRDSWEARHGIRIETSHPFRPFTALVSGHADVILVNALGIPALTRGLDHEPVIFGKYATDRSVAAVWRTSQAADFGDVMEATVAVDSEFGATLLWALIVDEAHGLDFSDGGPDYEFLTASLDLGDAVDRGEADACICMPDHNAGDLSAGLLRPLYDGLSASRLYATLVDDPSRLPLGEVFLADGSWYAAHPEAAAAFLELWELAVQHWHDHSADVIAAYPELLSVQSEAESAWLVGYVADNNWIVETVHVDAAEAQTYAAAVERLREIGLIEADAPVTRVVHEGPSGG
ncbi:MAG: hypothetical protein OXH86_00540 [Acidimicrobiaceae bacterium]|nr:hypothetical protein [Acidimicrobiaceae bacterium]MDE0319397.1 hypothetical protein [Acidimicrobiaceae bacterium]MDE0495815.1 hypothetical protein [Acidimicrobiaceae bacterium]